MDSTQKLMAQIWVKALNEGEVTLEFPVKSDATRAKFLLYGLSKIVKQGKVDFNPELIQAVNDCMISQVGETKLVIRHKALSPFLLAISTQLGLDPNSPDMKSDLEREAEASAERMMRVQQEVDRKAQEVAETPKFVNPYAAVTHQNDPNRKGGE